MPDPDSSHDPETRVPGGLQTTFRAESFADFSVFRASVGHPMLPVVRHDGFGDASPG